MMRAGAFKAGLAMAGIFLAGLAAGGFAGVAWYKSNTFPPRMTVQEYAARQLERMTKDLHLTEEQLVRVRPMVEEFSAQLRDARRRAMGEASDLWRAFNGRLEAELTPEQIKIHRENLERFEKEAAKRAKGGDRPPPPPGQPHDKDKDGKPAPADAPKLPPPEKPATGS
jgi:hypothetical protein